MPQNIFVYVPTSEECQFKKWPIYLLSPQFIRLPDTNLPTVLAVERKVSSDSQDLQLPQDTHPREELWPSKDNTTTLAQKVGGCTYFT